MLEAGLLQEIRSLLQSGVPDTATAMQAIGYKEFVSALNGHGTVEVAADSVRQAAADLVPPESRRSLAHSGE